MSDNVGVNSSLETRSSEQNRSSEAKSSEQNSSSEAKSIEQNCSLEVKSIEQNNTSEAKSSEQNSSSESQSIDQNNTIEAKSSEHKNSLVTKSSLSNEQRRKRVNRIKTVIIVAIVLLLILPSVFCAILGIRVMKLQKQVQELADIHNKYGMTYDEPDFGSLADIAGKTPIFLTGVPHLTGIPPIVETDTNSTADAAKDDQAGSNNITVTAADRADSSDTASVSGSSINADSTDIDGLETGSASSAGDNGPDPAQMTTPVPEVVSKPDDITGAAADNDISIDSGTAAAGSGFTPIAGSFEGKSVYLTFDDGPSVYTGDILDILARYNVKATFFVIGKTDKASKKLYKRIVDEGHTLGMHSYSHKYDIIYNSAEDFDKDFTKLWKLLYDTTGYKPAIYRFPGGSYNDVNKHGMDDFIRYLNNAGIVYYDWNVVSGDATGIDYTDEQLVQNVLDGVAAKNKSIVLMHDALSKKATVDTLPELLEKLLLGGAQVLPIDETVKPIQMIKADSIK